MTIRVGLVGLVALVCGCSSAPSDDFVGTWKQTEGTTTLTCNGTTTTQALSSTNTDTWSEGSANEVELRNEFGGLAASIEERQATMTAGEPWLMVFPGKGAVSPVTGVPDDSLSGSVELTSYTFTLVSDKSARESFTGTADVTLPSGPATCTVSGEASYSKL